MRENAFLSFRSIFYNKNISMSKEYKKYQSINNKMKLFFEYLENIWKCIYSFLIFCKKGYNKYFLESEKTVNQFWGVIDEEEDPKTT